MRAPCASPPFPASRKGASEDSDSPKPWRLLPGPDLVRLAVRVELVRLQNRLRKILVYQVLRKPVLDHKRGLIYESFILFSFASFLFLVQFLSFKTELQKYYNIRDRGVHLNL